VSDQKPQSTFITNNETKLQRLSACVDSCLVATVVIEEHMQLSGFQWPVVSLGYQFS